MAKVHDRILEFTIVLNAGADTLAVTDVKFYRDRGQLAAGVGYVAGTFTGGAAAVSPREIAMGETLPPATHYRFVFANF